MKTFEEFVNDWWQNYLSEADDQTLKALMENLIGEEETIEDYIPEDADSPYDWLMANMTANEIYSKYFGSENDGLCPDNMPDTAEFVYQMLKENAGWFSPKSPEQASTLPSFSESFLRNMADHIDGYDNPEVFFKDLAYGGCVSGMIGMLIYNTDCKRIYIENMDDMEEYAEQIYGEVGFVENKNHLPHYTYICWMCYEEFAFQIGRALFPETF